MLRQPSRSGCNLNRIICAVTFLLAVSASLPAWAGAILDMPIGSGGFIEYQSCAKNPTLLGRGIRVGELMYGSNVLPMLGGRLVFSSGSFIGSNKTGWFWGAGGSVSITGCADLNHTAGCTTGDFKGTLMTGSFLDAKLIDLNGKEVLEAQIIEELNPQLAALLHLPQRSYTADLFLSLSSLQGGWVRYAVQTGSLNIPESSTLFLLGAGLFCLAVVSIRHAAGVKRKPGSGSRNRRGLPAAS